MEPAGDARTSGDPAPGAPGDQVFTSGAWLAWLAAGAALTLSLPNPLYTLIVLLAVNLVRSSARPVGEGWQPSMLRLSSLILAYSAAFHALFVHAGATVLVMLPRSWPLIGGAITLESLVYGVANGLWLLALLSLFVAFNAVVPTQDLVRLLPAGLRDMGIAILIAITYVPATATHWRRIQAAQAIRGHAATGWRAWRPLVLPLLIGGLERASALAEAMVARGYLNPRAQGRRGWYRAGLLLALAGLLLGWLLAAWFGPGGWWLSAGGGALLFGLLLATGRRRRNTRYRGRDWGWRDRGLVALTLLALLLVWLPGWESQTYAPYPRLALPAFDPVVGLACALLAIPAAWLVGDRA